MTKSSYWAKHFFYKYRYKFYKKSQQPIFYTSALERAFVVYSPYILHAFWQRNNFQVSWPFLRFKKMLPLLENPPSRISTTSRVRKLIIHLANLTDQTFHPKITKQLKDIKWWNQPQGDGIEMTPIEKVGCCWCNCLVFLLQFSFPIKMYYRCGILCQFQLELWW